MEENFMEYLLKNIPGLLLEDLELLSRYITYKSFKSGDIYMKPGDENNTVYFIKKGIIRIFLLQDKGVEKTIIFNNKNSFFSNYDSVIYNNPSRFYYECVGDTELFELSYNDIDLCAQKSQSFNNLRSHLFLIMIGKLMTNVEDFVLLNPEERYQKLLSENSSVLQKAPSKYIATLLGITPVSLSRIRRRIFKGN